MKLCEQLLHIMANQKQFSEYLDRAQVAEEISRHAESLMVSASKAKRHGDLDRYIKILMGLKSDVKIKSRLREVTDLDLLVAISDPNFYFEYIPTKSTGDIRKKKKEKMEEEEKQAIADGFPNQLYARDLYRFLSDQKMDVSGVKWPHKDVFINTLDKRDIVSLIFKTAENIEKVSQYRYLNYWEYSIYANLEQYVKQIEVVI